MKSVINFLSFLWIYFFVIIFIVCFDARVADAQFCWGSNQLPKCKVFPLLEISYYGAMTSRFFDKNLFVWEGGVMLNINQQNAIGASLWVGRVSYGQRQRDGYRIRYHRWLRNRLSIDLSSGGVLLFANPKFTGELNLNYDDLLILSLRRHKLFIGGIEHYIGLKVGSKAVGVGARPGESNNNVTKFIAGVVGGAMVGLAGGLIGVGIEDCGNSSGDDFCGLAGPIIGGFIGYPIGSALGVSMVGNGSNENGSYGAALAGSIAGQIVGTAIFVVSQNAATGVFWFASAPIGATIGYNISR